MRFFHGGPIWPEEVAPQIWENTGALVSFARPEQINIAMKTARQVILDNGAFSDWGKRGRNKTPKEWDGYYEWVKPFLLHPRFEFAIVPDGIEAGETANKVLAEDCIDRFAQKDRNKWAVVWHLDESYAYLRWCLENFSVVCLGSTSAYPPGSNRWFEFMRETWADVIVDDKGHPKARIHGLRMLRKTIVSEFPFYSCDSSYVATHMNEKDRLWPKSGKMPNAKTRGGILRDDIEGNQSPEKFDSHVQQSLLKSLRT